MISLVRTMQWRKPVVAFLLSIIFGLACIYKFKTLTKVASGFQRKDTSHESGISVKHKTGQESSRRYGKVIHGTDHVIIYNSVPKCGSRTFQELSIKVFKEAALPVTVDTLRSPAAIENNKSYKSGYVQKLIARAKAPVYFQGHGPLVTFDKNPRPVYINFIRDPVSRMVSSFYFRRYGDGRLGVIGGPAPEAMKKMTIEDCILNRVGECTKPGKYPEIFCGFHPRCGTDHKWALEQAKSNIDKYYTFIGITEDYEASLRVLEHLMPDMYNGSIEVYHLLLNRATSIERSKTKNKKPLSQKLNDTVTKLLAVDYELYNYIYDRHRRLKVRFGIG